MVKLQKIIEQRFREQLTVAELARAAGFSQDYIAEQFRRHFGMTLRYLLSRRIEMARNLLLSTELPVKAGGVGMRHSRPQYYNKQFPFCQPFTNHQGSVRAIATPKDQDKGFGSLIEK